MDDCTDQIRAKGCGAFLLAWLYNWTIEHMPCRCKHRARCRGTDSDAESGILSLLDNGVAHGDKGELQRIYLSERYEQRSGQLLGTCSPRSRAGRYCSCHR